MVNKKKILIIEDDQSLSSAYRAKLSLHYDTRSAITGDEGIKLAHDWMPDLILLDLFLPGKTGQEVLQDFKGHAKTKHIPVIVLTNLEGQCDKMLELGAISCLIKTATSMQDIVQKIEEYLQPEV